MRIGIITYHRAFNCGALLQAWALGEFLSSHGYKVEFPDCNTVGLGRVWPRFMRPTLIGKMRNLIGWVLEQCRYLGTWPITVRRFSSFIDNNINHVKCDIAELSRYDLLVVGSDQVWNARISGNDSPLFLGENVERRVPMIGYGLSGGDEAMDNDSISRLRQAANRFSATGFREAYFKDIVACGGDVVCDPTFLLDSFRYDDIATKQHLVKGDYLFVYCVSDADEILPTAKNLAKRLGVRLIVSDVYRGGLFRFGYPFCNAFAMSPDRFLAYLRDARYVVVSSFHGCALSAIMRKNFLCLYSPSVRKGGRQHELMKRLGLQERRLPADASVDEMMLCIKKPCNAEGAIARERECSARWLLNSIKGIR